MNRFKGWLLAVMVLPAGPAARVIDLGNDNPAHLLPAPAQIEMNLRALDLRSRRSVPDLFAPWSDVGWKANKGLIAERFTDARFEAAPGWPGKREYLRSFSPEWIRSQGGPDRDAWVASLSPAEKYDLLVGTVVGGLAEHVGGFLDATLGKDAQFPGWWGLCEGGAASSTFYPEPVHPVVLHSEAYDLDIPFYAPDIKGLATMLWSRFNTELHLPESGLQCKADGTGCFDTNPASFHASVHHFLDLSPGVLVADMDPTPVVWNFPLVGYREVYFRPDRGAKLPARDLQSAMIRREDWAHDPRASQRSPGTVYVVGVRLDIRYAVNQHRVPPLEGSLKRQIDTRRLAYELELDADGNMLGGEWVSGAHPDLLWTVPKGADPTTAGDKTLPVEIGGLGNVIPKTWRSSALLSASKLTPLRRVVEILVTRSSAK